jgi:hypothetical protein
MAATGRLQGEIGIQATATIKLTHYRKGTKGFGKGPLTKRLAGSTLSHYVRQKPLNRSWLNSV